MTNLLLLLLLLVRALRTRSISRRLRARAGLPRSRAGRLLACPRRRLSSRASRPRKRLRRQLGRRQRGQQQRPHLQTTVPTHQRKDQKSGQAAAQLTRAIVTATMARRPRARRQALHHPLPAPSAAAGTLTSAVPSIRTVPRTFRQRGQRRRGCLQVQRLRREPASSMPRIAYLRARARAGFKGGFVLWSAPCALNHTRVGVRVAR